jgi:hypothetical protein
MTKPAMAGPLTAVLLAAASLGVSEARAEPLALQGMPAAADELSKARTIQTGPASWYGPGFHGQLGRDPGKVNDAAVGIRAPVIDPHHHRAAGLLVHDPSDAFSRLRHEAAVGLASVAGDRR